MPPAVLKLFAKQGTMRTDGQSSDYMFPSMCIKNNNTIFEGLMED